MRLTSINHDSSMDLAVRKVVARQVLAEFSLPAGADYEASKPLIAEALAKAAEAGPVEKADVENLLQRLSMAGVVVGDVHKEAQFWQNLKERAQEWGAGAAQYVGDVGKTIGEKGKAKQQQLQQQRQQRQKAQEAAAAEQAKKQKAAESSAQNIQTLDQQRAVALQAYAAYSEAVSAMANMPGGRNYANLLRMLDHTYLSKLLTYPIEKHPDEQFAKYYRDVGLQSEAAAPTASTGGAVAAPAPVAPAVPAASAASAASA